MLRPLLFGCISLMQRVKYQQKLNERGSAICCVSCFMNWIDKPIRIIGERSHPPVLRFGDQ